MSTSHAFRRKVFLAVLACAGVANANADILYTTLGGVENNGDSVSTAGPVLANRFVNVTVGFLNSVSVNLTTVPFERTDTPGLQGVNVDLFSDAGANGPGKATVIGTISDFSFNPNAFAFDFQIRTVNAAAPILLAANTSYYVGIEDLGLSSVILGNTLDPAVISRGPVVAGGFYYNSNGVQANAGGPYEISINTSASGPIAVPEPGTFALIGLGVFGFLASRRKSVDTL